jgi:hypothetical protein
MLLLKCCLHREKANRTIGSKLTSVTEAQSPWLLWLSSGTQYSLVQYWLVLGLWLTQAGPPSRKTEGYVTDTLNLHQVAARHCQVVTTDRCPQHVPAHVCSLSSAGCFLQSHQAPLLHGSMPQQNS